MIALNDGDIVQLDLNPTKGREKNKIRPCLIVECHASPLNLVLVMPITDASGKRGKKLFLEINDLKRAKLSKPSVIDIYQIRAVDPVRIISVIGSVEDGLLKEARRRFGLVLDLEV